MSTLARPVVISDVLPKIKLRDAVLVLGTVVLTALIAQVELSVGFLPEAIVGTSLAVLLAGAMLGSRLGAISMAAYAVVGLVLPVYAGGEQGTNYLFGETGGYLFGGIVAAYLVGLLAERSQDRSILTAIPAMLFGVATIATFGVLGGVIFGDSSVVSAVEGTVAGKFASEIVIALAAGIVLPLLWKLTSKKEVTEA